MRKILALIITVSFILACNHMALAASEKEVFSKTKKLYIELMEFKGNKEFHNVGFGQCCKYYKWLQKVKAISNNDARKLLKYGFVPGDIEMLAREYKRSKGKETNYSKDMNRRLRTVFNLDSASKNIPKGKMMVVKSEDIACKKMEYYKQFWKALKAGDYASSTKHIAPPRCIDLYIGTKVEGPLGSETLESNSSRYIKIKYEGKNYWISEAMVK
jgi:hypothetical protein